MLGRLNLHMKKSNVKCDIGAYFADLDTDLYSKDIIMLNIVGFFF